MCRISPDACIPQNNVLRIYNNSFPLESFLFFVCPPCIYYGIDLLAIVCPMFAYKLSPCSSLIAVEHSISFK